MTQELSIPDESLNSVITGNRLSEDNHNLTKSDEKSRSWFSKHKYKLALGAAAASAAFTLVADPFEETREAVGDAAPWVAGGVAASEVLFIAGAGMMVASVGDKVGNPLTMKKRMGDIAQKANESNLFKAGFIVNTTGAVGDFVVLSGGVMRELPPTSWGVLSLTLLDLSLTVAVRKGIMEGIHQNIPVPEAEV
ncbi:MAG: hypothetical protein M3Q14_03110 [bacterium]|nr:hypothetical protein [bacterium]